MVNPTGFTRRGFPYFRSEDPKHESDNSGHIGARKRFLAAYQFGRKTRISRSLLVAN
jgi:hypothetical protein